MIADTWGVNLVLRTGKDLTGATLAEIIIESPTGVSFTKTAQISGGDLIYETEEGVFTMGDVDYQLQGVVYFGATRKLRSLPKTLPVGRAA